MKQMITLFTRTGLSRKLPQSARSIELEVGQSADMVSGTIEEPHARQVTAPPEPAGAESALERLRRTRPEENTNAPDRR